MKNTHPLALAAALATFAFGAAHAEGNGHNIPADHNLSVAGANAWSMAPDARRMGAAAAPKVVGGAPMYANRDIIDNAIHSKDHTTLVAAVKAAGLVDTLKGPGPFTVFAPTNSAFSELPAGAVDNLLQPQNKGQLTGVLTYHVVPGRLDAAALAERIRAGGGRATLTTVQGGTLTASMRGNDIVVTDAAGHAAVVTTADVLQSNGVIHVVDHVLMPG